MDNTIVVTVKRLNKEFIVTDQNGKRYSVGDHSGERTIPLWMANKAIKQNVQLRMFTNKNGQIEWRRFKKDEPDDEQTERKTHADRAKELKDENIKPNAQ